MIEAKERSREEVRIRDPDGDQYPGSAAFGEGLPAAGRADGAVVCDTGFVRGAAPGAAGGGLAEASPASATPADAEAAAVEACGGVDEGEDEGAADDAAEADVAAMALGPPAGTSGDVRGAEVSLTTVATPIDPTISAAAPTAKSTPREVFVAVATEAVVNGAEVTP